MAIITVPFEEMRTSGSQTFEDDADQSTRKYLVAWADAPLFAEQVRGRAGPRGQATFGFTAPFRDPERPFLFARSVSYDGIGVPAKGDDGAIDYDKAVVTVTFRPLDFNPEEDPTEQGVSLRESRDFAARFFSFKEGTFAFNEGFRVNEELGEGTDFAKMVPEMIWSLEANRWVGAPVQDIDSPFEQGVGKVNKERFRALWTTFEKETLLFEGARYQRKITPQGVFGFQVSMQFRRNPNGWNKFWDGKAFSGIRDSDDPPGSDDFKVFETFDFLRFLPGRELPRAFTPREPQQPGPPAPTG